MNDMIMLMNTILIDLKITFDFSKIRIITIVLMMKVFRKKIMTMSKSTMNIHQSIINNRRVKRNIQLFINTTILNIKIVFIISINQIIALNNQNRRRLKQINHTKKIFRNRFFKINRIDSLNLCFRIRFNKKTRSIFNLKVNRSSRIVLLMIFLTLIINIKIDNRLINDLIFRYKINEFILLKMIKKISMKKSFKTIIMTTIMTMTTNICRRKTSRLKKSFTNTFIIINNRKSKKSMKSFSQSMLSTLSKNQKSNHFSLKYRKTISVVVDVVKNFHSTTSFIITSNVAKCFFSSRKLSTISRKSKSYALRLSKTLRQNSISNFDVTSS